VILLGVPAVGLLISALAFHETVNASLGLGVALVSAGILLTTTDLSQKWPSKAALAKR
jgi:drug/metabolite transporter (DMT)-like permease